MRVFCVSPSPSLGCTDFALRAELSEQLLKHGLSKVISTQAQNPTSRMCHHTPSFEYT